MLKFSKPFQKPLIEYIPETSEDKIAFEKLKKLYDSAGRNTSLNKKNN
ncbi:MULTISPECIES: hypothetical protein [Flavobacteriaceae]